MSLLLLGISLVACTRAGALVTASCPDNVPTPTTVCTTSSECRYGNECCCGACHDGVIATCVDGVWQVMNTDACLVPCGSDAKLTVEVEEEGTAELLPP
mmetsp:Transcript_34248/g.91430  ORF Transcript_34248/g.91430 Transcript_34248/m.91430 type:complete len:99 (-) Transcript_34248:100-396(-)